MRVELGNSAIRSDHLWIVSPSPYWPLLPRPWPLITLLAARIDKPSIRANSHGYLGSWGTISLLWLCSLKGPMPAANITPAKTSREEKQQQKLAGMRFEALVPPRFVSQWGNLEELLRPPLRGPFHHEKPLCNPDSFLYVPRLWCFCLEQKSPLPCQTVPVDTNIDRAAKAIQVGISPWESTEDKENDSDFKPSSFSKGLSRVLETLRTCLRHGLSICIVRGCV